MTLAGISGTGLSNDSTTTQILEVATITVSSSQAWRLNASGGLWIRSGNVQLGGNTLSASGLGTGVATIDGILSGSGGGLTKSGSFELILGGENTYTGLTTVSDGVVSFSGAGRLGSGGALLLGGILEVDGDSRLGTSGGVTFNGGSLVLSGNLTTSRSVGLTGAGTLNTAGFNAAWSGAVTGAGTLIKDGAGTLSLNSASSFGELKIQSGTVALGADVTLTTGLTLAGGTVRTGDRVILGGGQLRLTASSVLDLGAGGTPTVFNFGSAVRTGGRLTIENWTGTYLGGTGDRIFIAASPNADFLAHVDFDGFASGAAWLGSGELVPVPEPGKVATFGLMLLGAVPVAVRRWKGRGIA